MPYYHYKDQKIFYEDQGSGHCLFFVHEWNSSSLFFRRHYLNFLAKKVRVVCIDLPGYGNSEFVDSLRFDDFSQILNGLLDHLEIRRCTLMGFCLGSAIILDFSLKYPSRVNFLILIEPVMVFPKILIPLLIPKFGVGFLKFLAKNRLLFSLIGSQLIGRDREMNSRIFRSIGKNDPAVSERYLKMLYTESQRNELPAAESVDGRKGIFILGEKSNPLFKKNADYIAGRFGIRDSVVLRDARHFVLAERAPDISKIVLQCIHKSESEFTA
jgi:pimeloyl-ACP methyl ester carboxylesterase